jgi:hypothetical protein
MAQFRVFFSGKVEDKAAYLDLVGKMIAFVKENEPGTGPYGSFVSEDGATINEDGFDSAASFFTHLGNMQEQGWLDQYLALVTLETVRVLGDAGPEVLEALAGFGGAHYPLKAGF